MNIRIANMDQTLRKVLCSSLVVAAYAGGSAVEAGVRAEEPGGERTVETIRAAAARGDAQALYWLAMMHIEGTITGADYRARNGTPEDGVKTGEQGRRAHVRVHGQRLQR